MFEQLFSIEIIFISHRYNAPLFHRRISVLVKSCITTGARRRFGIPQTDAGKDELCKKYRYAAHTRIAKFLSLVLLKCCEIQLSNSSSMKTNLKMKRTTLCS
ncbi:hypothetical protein NPIL_251451 [Nephila pilipes]|uniref:Uncharacterized protein n=1 Tax=Nephila pilipes TaxID=299642 RepID=A0A8X6T6K2_NEPPI|nr:hypothetical protein NPIL_251451 [Nephila pilipes]